jgi:dTDP-4-amino-4,6-dideoxygalactose transaminase
VTYEEAQPARAANYAFLLERLKRFVPEPFTRLHEGASPFAFPIQSERNKELLDRLHQHGIWVENSWPVPHPDLKATDFPRAAALRKNVITLPVHQELGIKELERIVSVVLGSPG